MAQKVHLTIKGKTYTYYPDTSLYTISRDFQDKMQADIIVARVDGRLTELSRYINHDAAVEFLTTADPLGNQIYRRTATMVLLKAFEDVLGKEHLKKLTVQYSLDKGYYCELDADEPLSDTLLLNIKTTMHTIADSKITIHKRRVSKQDALDIFRDCGMQDKYHLFKFRRSSTVNLYMMDETIDYFYGYMAPDTSYIRYFDLYLYDEGFVLQLPEAGTPDMVEPFEPPAKLFNVLKQSTRWGEVLGVRTVADINQTIANGEFFDLVLVQEALQEKKIAEIAEQILDTGKRIILIAGPSSSGKTSFSHRLSIQLRAHGLKPHPIPVDNYFKDREQTPVDASGNLNFECLEAIDLAGFNNDMQGLLDGKAVELPIFNFVTGKRESKGEILQIGERDVLVIEGIHALNNAMTYSLKDDSKFKIYISALTQLNIDEHNRIPTTDARLIRRMVRDAAKRGTNASKTIAMWQSVRRGEEENIFPYQEACDVMFNSALIYELAVLKQYAEPLLFSVKPEQPEYEEAKRLIKFLDYFLGISSEHIPNNSIIREFIGGSCFNVG